MKAIHGLVAAVAVLFVGQGCNALTGVEPPELLGSGGAGQPLPDLVASAHVQLWLTADKGLDCDTVTGRVRGWRDQSGHARDTATSYGQLPPRCNVHTLGGLQVPFFDAPTPADDRFVDGTLDVDLGFLEHTDYTIFVVERRWADRSGGTEACMLLGTTLPADSQTCATGAEDRALIDGYVYYDGHPAIDSDFTCVGCRAPIAPVPAVPPAAASIYMNRFAFMDGLELWVNGEEVASTATFVGLETAAGGALGRAVYVTAPETRYIGDIAEVVIFDAALGPADQQEMEAYLIKHWAQPFAMP